MEHSVSATPADSQRDALARAVIEADSLAMRSREQTKSIEAMWAALRRQLADQVIGDLVLVDGLVLTGNQRIALGGEFAERVLLDAATRLGLLVPPGNGEPEEETRNGSIVSILARIDTAVGQPPEGG